METFFPLISSKEFPHWPIQNPLDNFSPSICFLIDWSRLFRLQSNGVIKLENVHLNNVIVSQNGISLTASDDKDPYSKLKGYFDHLMKVTPAKNMKAVFSPPYVDGWGLGKKAKNFDFTLVSRPHRQVLCLNTRHQIVADCMVVFHNTFFPFQSLFKLTKISRKFRCTPALMWSVLRSFLLTAITGASSPSKGLCIEWKIKAETILSLILIDFKLATFEWDRRKLGNLIS